MRNFKTDKWYLVSIDYVDFYYTRRDVREYLGYDEYPGWVVYIWNQELASIDDIWIAEEGINYLLYRKLSEGDEFVDKRDTSDFEENADWYESQYLHYEDDFRLLPFYVSYYGSWQYRVQFCDAKEADWILFIKKEISKDTTDFVEKELKKMFECYMNGEFYQANIYQEREAKFIDTDLQNKKIIFYEYQESSPFLTSEEEIFESLPEYCWKILKETESTEFNEFELVENNDN